MTKQTVMVTIQIVDDNMIQVELGTKIGEMTFAPDEAVKFAEALLKKAEEAKQRVN